MKKIVLTMFLAASSFFCFSQTAFTPNNLVVLRAGNGTATTNGVPVSLLEFNRTGENQSPINTVNIPFKTVSGEPETFVLDRVADNYAEGALSLSSDGQHLVFAGYNTYVGYNVGEKTPASASANDVSRSIAMVDASKGVTLKRISVPGASAIRAGIVQDTNIWVVGGNAFTVRWINSNDPTANVQIAPRNPYSGNNLQIFKGKIYCTNSSTSGTGITGLYVIDSLYNYKREIAGTKLNLPDAGIVPSGFVLFDTNNDGNPDLIYLADETLGLQKFSFNGSAWVNKGVYAVPNGSTAKRLRGLVGYHNKDDNTYIIYGNTSSSVIEFVDASAPTEERSITNRMLVSSAGTNYAFRGISFTPGSTILPVKLTSFNSKKIGNHVQLNWATASEKGNSHFEILRSASGKEFNNIGNVKGAGDSSQEVKYFFTDYNPLNGVNYYKLKQVDFNGKSEESSVVSEAFQLNEATFSLTVKEESIELLTLSEKLTEAEISITDIVGKTIKSLNFPIVKGNNKIEIPVNLQSGVHIVTLSSNGQAKRIKFIK